MEAFSCHITDHGYAYCNIHKSCVLCCFQACLDYFSGVQKLQDPILLGLRNQTHWCEPEILLRVNSPSFVSPDCEEFAELDLFAVSAVVGIRNSNRKYGKLCVPEIAILKAHALENTLQEPHASSCCT